MVAGDFGSAGCAVCGVSHVRLWIGAPRRGRLVPPQDKGRLSTLRCFGLDGAQMSRCAESEVGSYGQEFVRTVVSTLVLEGQRHSSRRR